MNSREIGSASLSTHEDADLLDPRTRDTVIAAANGLAERTGIRIDEIACAADRLTIQVEGPTLMAIGLLAELRRSTDHWHVQKFGSHLWMTGPDDDRDFPMDDHE
ncbi:MAG: hypothetical protein P8J59_00490 [Phycisphaerales bacterium]|jgi:hypothetical protein|nr:hypothetical protein [Phycisphaerales bacterium]